MQKRGLSGVITTLLIIMVSLTAVIILWAVISNIINKGSNEVNLGAFTININIKKVISYANGTDVTVKRNTGQGNLSGIRFIVFDGTNTYLLDKKDIPLNELEEKTFNINYTGPIKKISVSPIIKLGSTDTPQNPSDELEYTTYNTVKNMAGLVSWYKFEGNANDEMGINTGINYDESKKIQGKFGKGYSFLAGTSPITISNNQPLNLSNSNFTIVLWINATRYAGAKRPIFWKGFGTFTNLPAEEYGLMIYKPTGSSTDYLYGGTNKSSVIGNTNITALQTSWMHVATSQAYNINGNTITSVYVNGNLDGQTTTPTIATSTTSYDVGIGPSSISYILNAVVDELMIFNRTLGDQEIKALYTLDLSK